MGSPATTGQRPRAIQLKYVIFVLFTAMIVLVWITRDRFLLQPGSFLRQRYSPIAPLMFLHGVPGALALFLGIFQFSSRLRRRYLQVHRVMGRIYVGCVALAAPAAVIIAAKLPIPTLMMASVIQALGWVAATATALYCVRTGRIAQHREWMIRAMSVVVGVATVRPVMGVFFATSRMSGLTVEQFFGIAFWIGFSMTYLAGEAWIRYTRREL